MSAMVSRYLRRPEECVGLLGAGVTVCPIWTLARALGLLQEQSAFKTSLSHQLVSFLSFSLSFTYLFLFYVHWCFACIYV